MLTLLDEEQIDFPDPEQALQEPDGLLAVGGDLSVPRLIEAYRQGVFPWFSMQDPILWWSPDPRAIFLPDQIHISRTLRKFLRKTNYTITINRSFADVIRECAQAPRDHDGTWITPAMIDAYTKLHLSGHAHSIEVWRDEELVGGLYGVLTGKIFSGESMFHKADHASKIALLALAKHLEPAGLTLIDCQMPNDHLMSLGALEMGRRDYMEILKQFRDDKMADSLFNCQLIELHSRDFLA